MGFRPGLRFMNESSSGHHNNAQLLGCRPETVGEALIRQLPLLHRASGPREFVITLQHQGCPTSQLWTTEHKHYCPYVVQYHCQVACKKTLSGLDRSLRAWSVLGDHSSKLVALRDRQSRHTSAFMSIELNEKIQIRVGAKLQK
ncbi:unnamed protein product [Protopolystoma xenopodis]|uniref:Uncharacterized protein n=1 Tax=Protopolystoma xenopodis TaxID=117903 RepID=A0A448X8D1_9PLAT|nr:unnamed protein product [Protopolystoma xenopodis]